MKKQIKGKKKTSNKKIRRRAPEISLSTDFEGIPQELDFEENKLNVPLEGERPEYAGKDNLAGGQEEISPTGPGSKEQSDQGESPQDEGYTAHAEERPQDRETDLPIDKTLSEIDDKTGKPGKRHKAECKADESCIKKHPDTPWK